MTLGLRLTRRHGMWSSWVGERSGPPSRRGLAPAIVFSFTIAILAGLVGCSPQAPGFADADEGDDELIDAPLAVDADLDRDDDGIEDTADNCADDANPNQENADADSQGDICDPDDDNDTILDTDDNCPLVANTDQLDTNGDGTGNACTDDADGDGDLDAVDNCPLVANADQLDTDNDLMGNACDTDDDGDTVLDTVDNCPIDANTPQDNHDTDPLGDACDDDDDGDGDLDVADNCPIVANPDQANSDTDTLGDVCDPDDDGDTVLDGADNCPLDSNPSQADSDGDGDGTAVAGTYVLRPVPATVAIAGDDAVSPPIAIGFPFEFYGQTYTSINVSTNGFVTVGDTSNGCCAGGPIPSATAPNGVIALYWIDLNQSSGGSITWGLQGTAPNRELVVSWNAVPHFSGGLPVTGQIVLHETTSLIELVCATCTTNGGIHTQGAESADGLSGVGLAGRIATSFSATNDAVIIDTHIDPDGFGDACDVCPGVYDPLQADGDGDGAGNLCDVCLTVSDPLQTDGDTDGRGDACDNCPAIANPGQADFNNDNQGDVCDDTDSDTVFDATDNCRLVSNTAQTNGDGDTIGDVCDNCPAVTNQNQADGDGDMIGDACEDSDGDGVLDVVDNCPAIANTNQADGDGDSIGDVCDPDLDNDTILNAVDNCPLVANTNQANFNLDGEGDVCDDTDSDTVFDDADNCRLVSNLDQADSDGITGAGDGHGNACDNCPFISNPTQADGNNNGIGDACDGNACATPVADGCGPVELCGNGVDDNCDSATDENCACTPGSVQACFRGQPGRRNVGACTDGSQVCNVAGTSWGACVDGVSPSAEVEDNLDNDCDSCVDDGATGTVGLACPAPGSMPGGNPFDNYVIDGTQFFSGTVTTWRWEVVGGPCDRLFATTTNPLRQTFTLTGQGTSSLTLRPQLSGDYTVRVFITLPSGEVLTCTFIIKISSPGLRVETCSDRSGATDIDLHMHRPGTTTDWFSATDDCYYSNCKSGSATPPNWSFPNSPLSECVGGPEGAGWQTLGYCRNPRLDIDSISNNGVPENINVDNPANAQTFRVMTHYYSGTGVVRPMVNVYCAGVLRGSYGGPTNELTNFDTSGSTTGDIWRVVDATVSVNGSGVTTGCTLTPLHPPAQSTGYWVTNDRTY